MTDEQKSACSCIEDQRPVFGLNNSRYNTNKPAGGVMDLRSTMLGRVTDTVSAARNNINNKGREYAVKALMVHLMLIEHGISCPYVEALRDAYPKFFGNPLIDGDSSDDDMEVRVSTLRKPETSTIPTHEFYRAATQTQPVKWFSRTTYEAPKAVPEQATIRHGKGTGLAASRWAV
jgi:hypothetical protein